MRLSRFAGRTRAFVRARLDPHSHLGLGLTLRLVLFVAAVWAFGGLLDAVLDNATLVRIDLAVAGWFHGHTTPAGLRIFAVVTQFGSPVVNVLVVVVAFFLWRRGDWPLLWTWLAANVGGKVIEYTLKSTVHRTRPEYAVEYLHGRSYSFPSGHTMGSTICYLFLAYIIAIQPHAAPTLRRVVFLGAAFMIAIVALSRLYLGVHYPTDVAGGFAAGLAWLSLCGVTRRIAAVRPV